MKVNKFPENLDVIIEFANDRAVCTKRLNFATQIINVKSNIKNISFIKTIMESDKKATVGIYNFILTKEGCEVEVDELLEVSYDDKGLKFVLNGAIVDIDGIKPFFDTLGESDDNILSAIIQLSYNAHGNRIGFIDIYKELHSKYRNSRYGFKRLYTNICYYYYLSTPEMYLIMEKLIKVGMSSEIDKYNPVVSKKPIPNISEIKMLSKVSIDLINRFGHRNEDLGDLLEKLEKNPNVGVNGIKLIEEIYKLYDNIEHIPYDNVCKSFYGYSLTSLLEGFQVITKQFNITAKNLANKIIRASFYENLSPSSFIQLVTDYIKMSKLMHLTLPEKMPKDIVKQHDLIASQYKYIQNKVIEDNFKKNVVKNKELLKSVSSHAEYVIISPEVPNDLITEGLQMHHCVGTYVNRYASGSSKIFFLRKKSDPETPCVTIELNKFNHLVQARAFANSNPSKDMMTFINNWVDTLE